MNFLEVRNGRPALDLIVYLGAYDSWSAAITQVDDDGGAILRTQDSSCTTPAMPAGGLPFSSGGYDGSGDLPADHGPANIARTREGSIEVIAGGAVEGSNPTAAALIVDESGTPAGCASLPGSMQDDIVATAASLRGYAAIIDVGEGTYYPYEPTAIAEFSDVPLFTRETGPHEPSPASSNSAVAAIPGGATAYFSITDAYPFDEVVYRAEFEHGIDAVSAVLMAHSVHNDFLLSQALGAATDWVINFPTLRFYRDPIHSQESQPFLTRGEVAVHDPNGRRILPDESDTTRDDVDRPYNVNVIGLSRGEGDAVSPVFASRLATHFDPGVESGTMRLDIGGHRTGAELLFADASGVQSSLGFLWGTPVTGFMAYNIINANAQPGRLANYGGTFAHRQSSCMRTGSIHSFVCSTC